MWQTSVAVKGLGIWHLNLQGHIPTVFVTSETQKV